MPTNILDDDDLNNLNAALEQSETAEEEILRAEQAGIDVSGARQRLDDAKTRIRRVKDAFFPNR